MPERIGVFVCHCGQNIAGSVDVEKVRDEAAKLAGVVHAEDYVFMCSDPGQAMIQEDIKKYNLDGVVVSSCSPLMHETTFRKAIKGVGLNEYLFNMANIREQVSWVIEDEEKATEKAKAQLAAAVKRQRSWNPLKKEW